MAAKSLSASSPEWLLVPVPAQCEPLTCQIDQLHQFLHPFRTGGNQMLDPGSFSVFCALLLPSEENVCAWLGTKTHQEVRQPGSSRCHRVEVGRGQSVSGDTGLACQGTADFIPRISAASSSSCHQLGALGRKENQESSSPGAHASLDKSHLADGDSGGPASPG